jgi:hypothetical protein
MKGMDALKAFKMNLKEKISKKLNLRDPEQTTTQLIIQSSSTTSWTRHSQPHDGEQTPTSHHPLSPTPQPMTGTNRLFSRAPKSPKATLYSNIPT